MGNEGMNVYCMYLAETGKVNGVGMASGIDDYMSRCGDEMLARYRKLGWQMCCLGDLIEARDEVVVYKPVIALSADFELRKLEWPEPYASLDVEGYRVPKLEEVDG